MIKKCLKIFILSLFLFNFSMSLVSAEVRKASDPVSFTPQVTIPGSNFIKGQVYEIESDTTTLAKYVKAIYDYLLSIVGIAAAIVLMVGGIMWLTAGGSSERVGQAKSWISGSITGLVLALTSYLIMQTINPQLVSFTPTDVPKIKPIEFGCCQFETKSGKVAMDITDSECYEIYTRKIKVRENGELITKSFVENDPLGTTTTAALGDKSLSEYLTKVRFDQEKKADYRTKTCQEMIYCLMRSFNEYGVSGEVVIEMPREQCSGDIRHNATAAPMKRTHEVILKDDLQNRPEVQQILTSQCEGREGNSCKNSWAIYCYCYGGKAYFNRGLQNEPCGNDMGKCVPNVTVDVGSLREPLCKNRDLGSRSCGGGLKCCEPDGLHGSYDPGDNYGVNVDINQEETD